MSIVAHCLEKPEIKVLMEILRKANTNAYIHSCNVATLVESMLELDSLHYNEDEREQIVIGALLHDIGKAFVPLNLTQTESILSRSERSIVNTHALLSYEIVYPISSDIVRNICLYHHERLNGTGYPEHKTMADLPDYVFLVQVADVFDALISPRAYKNSYSMKKAFNIMEKEVKTLEMDEVFFYLLKQVTEQKGGETDED